MNFLLARNKYKGKLNIFAYVGMMGDLVTCAALYAYYKYRQSGKAAKAEEQKVKDALDAKKTFPPSTEVLDYNMLSPYTPVPYHAFDITKYVHSHIDLIGYTNERNLNIDNDFFADFFNPYDKNKRYLNDWHDPYNTEKKHH